METADMSLVIDSTRLLALCWCNMPGLLTLDAAPLPTESTNANANTHLSLIHI